MLWADSHGWAGLLRATRDAVGRSRAVLDTLQTRFALQIVLRPRVVGLARNGAARGAGRTRKHWRTRVRERQRTLFPR